MSMSEKAEKRDSVRGSIRRVLKTYLRVYSNSMNLQESWRTRRVSTCRPPDRILVSSRATEGFSATLSTTFITCAAVFLVLWGRGYIAWYERTHILRQWETICEMSAHVLHSEDMEDFLCGASRHLCFRPTSSFLCWNAAHDLSAFVHTHPTVCKGKSATPRLPSFFRRTVSTAALDSIPSDPCLPRHP